jgi:hypothetical protein
VGRRSDQIHEPYRDPSLAPLTPAGPGFTTGAMAKISLPERGVLLVAALLLLAIFFSAYWIDEYVRPGGTPAAAIPWFLGAAGAIVLIGLLSFILGARRR